MRTLTLATLAMLLAAPAAFAQSGYVATDLLSPCVEADNDARWGETAELECEQYILGFLDGLKSTGDTTICPPAQNTADEARWAFMRWVHQDYSTRKSMTAADALMGALKERFACQ